MYSVTEDMLGITVAPDFPHMSCITSLNKRSTACESCTSTEAEAVLPVLQEMTLMYNLNNEPWPKYNMAAIADHGLKPSQWTSARFQTQVLLVETVR